jgi:hypothetical protein
MADRQAAGPLAPLVLDTGRHATRFARRPFARTRGTLMADARKVYVWLRRRYAPMLRALSRYLDRPIGDGERFTFREFVGFLASIDLESANPHVRRQLSPCERAGSLPELTILRIEETSARLPRLENELGLRHGDLTRLGSRHHHVREADVIAFVGDTPFGRRGDARIPRSANFYDTDLAAKVQGLYADDFEAYGYRSAAAGTTHDS